MILGAAVILIVGGLVVNYFRNLEPGTTLPSGLNVEQETNKLPTTHKVAAGETLWSISEDYYGTGFNWTDIRDANEINSPGVLEEGLELTIPNLETSPTPEATENKFAVAEEASATPEATVEPVVEQQVEEVATPTHTGTYTVVHGDSLWKIAVAQYGDGYKWIEIAEANDLANPQIIHAGNVLTLP